MMTWLNAHEHEHVLTSLMQCCILVFPREYKHFLLGVFKACFCLRIAGVAWELQGYFSLGLALMFAWYLVWLSFCLRIARLISVWTFFWEYMAYYTWEFIFASEYHDLFLSENLEVSFCMEIIGLFLSENCKAFVFPENNFCIRNYGTFFLPPFCLRIITLLYFFFSYENGKAYLPKNGMLILLKFLRYCVFSFHLFRKVMQAIPRKKNHYWESFHHAFITCRCTGKWSKFPYVFSKTIKENAAEEETAAALLSLMAWIIVKQ